MVTQTGVDVLWIRARKQVEARTFPGGTEQGGIAHVLISKQRVVRSSHSLSRVWSAVAPFQAAEEERTIVVIPCLIGTPWYRLRFKKRTVSSLPSILATLFVTVLTTGGSTLMSAFHPH